MPVDSLKRYAVGVDVGEHLDGDAEFAQ